MFTLIKTLLFYTLAMNSWQAANYDALVRKLHHQTSPTTTLKDNIGKNSVVFISYSAINDPHSVYSNVLHDTASVPTWLLLMRLAADNGKTRDELSHRGMHLGIPCNVLHDKKILFHIKTVGFIKTDIIFRVKYDIENTKYGIVVSAERDMTFPSDEVEEFQMILWAFPHPTEKNLIIVVSQGYVKSSFPIIFLNGQIKWHIDNMMQNLGERLMMVTQ